MAMTINITKQQIPECSIFLLANEAKASVRQAIDSILSQSCMDFNLFVVDFTTENVAQREVEDYEDTRVHYIAKQSDTPLISIFKNAKGKYISCVSPDMDYAPYFLYELRKILQEQPKVALAYSDFRQIDRTGSEEVIDAEEVFSKNNDIGYCFLVRKEVVGKASDSGVTIFSTSNLSLPIGKDCLLYHLPQRLGDKHCEVGAYALGWHYLRKAKAVRRKEGWRAVVRGGANLLRRSLGKVRSKSNQY